MWLTSVQLKLTGLWLKTNSLPVIAMLTVSFGYIDNPKTASWGIVGLWEGDHPGVPDSIRRYDNLPVYLKKQGTIDQGIASLYYY